MFALGLAIGVVLAVGALLFFQVQNSQSVFPVFVELHDRLSAVLKLNLIRNVMYTNQLNI
jgi:hypothetical protein